MTPREMAGRLCSPIEHFFPAGDSLYDIFLEDTEQMIGSAIAQENEACAAITEWDDIKSLLTVDRQVSDSIRSELATAIRARTKKK